MSKEEVMRKLQEIKQLYGSSPGGVLDIEVNQLDEDTLIDDDGSIDEGSGAEVNQTDNEVSDADKTGSSALQKVRRKFAASPDHADREPGEPRDPGPVDRFGFAFDFFDDGTQSSENGTKDKH